MNNSRSLKIKRIDYGGQEVKIFETNQQFELPSIPAMAIKNLPIPFRLLIWKRTGQDRRHKAENWPDLELVGAVPRIAGSLRIPETLNVSVRSQIFVDQIETQYICSSCFLH